MLMEILYGYITLYRDETGQLPIDVVNWFQINLHYIRFSAFRVIDYAGSDGHLALYRLIQSFPGVLF